jgi:hypothetical protein
MEIVPEIINFVKKQNELSLFFDKEMISIQEKQVFDKLEKDKEINKVWGEYFSNITDLNNEEMNDILNLEIYKKKIKKNYYIKKIDNIEELNKLNIKLEKLQSISKDITLDQKIKKLESKKKFIDNQILHKKLV